MRKALLSAIAAIALAVPVHAEPLCAPSLKMLQFLANDIGQQIIEVQQRITQQGKFTILLWAHPHTEEWTLTITQGPATCAIQRGEDYHGVTIDHLLDGSEPS